MNSPNWETHCGDADAAVTARIHSGWFKFQSLVPFLTVKYVSLKLEASWEDLFCMCEQQW